MERAPHSSGDSLRTQRPWMIAQPGTTKNSGSSPLQCLQASSRSNRSQLMRPSQRLADPNACLADQPAMRTVSERSWCRWEENCSILLSREIRLSRDSDYFAVRDSRCDSANRDSLLFSSYSIRRMLFCDGRRNSISQTLLIRF